MPESAVKLREVKEYARREDATHKATDKRFNNRVHIVHEDGSVFITMNAFLEERDEYVIVYAEHHDTLVYPKSDLIVCQETVPMKYKHISVGE